MYIHKVKCILKEKAGIKVNGVIYWGKSWLSFSSHVLLHKKLRVL